MAQFFPKITDAIFTSEGELRLYRLLSKLDDEYTIIHSCPWLRSSVKRIFSAELNKYVDAYRHSKKNISGEIDFVISHPSYGILCVEVKSGQYRPAGTQFIHMSRDYRIDPLNQVKNNAFTILEVLEQESMRCPVGYAIYFPDSDLDVAALPIAFKPIGDSNALADGIFLLPRHESDISRRIQTLFEFWKRALGYDSAVDEKIKEAVKCFINAVWPQEVRDDSIGRKIAFDGEAWLQLDKNQIKVVQDCMKPQTLLKLVAGFAGSGKTVIASSLALSKAEDGKNVLLLFKNKKIAQHVESEIKRLAVSLKITVSTFHAFCASIGHKQSISEASKLSYNKHFEYLLTGQNDIFQCLIIDEAQGLSESEHIALKKYFKSSEKYIFADKHQIFKNIEEGSTYEFLEELYGASFYYLTSVYRNPSPVTQVIEKMVLSDRDR